MVCSDTYFQSRIYDFSDSLIYKLLSEISAHNINTCFHYPFLRVHLFRFSIISTIRKLGSFFTFSLFYKRLFYGFPYFPQNGVCWPRFRVRLQKTPPTFMQENHA